MLLKVFAFIKNNHIVSIAIIDKLFTQITKKELFLKKTFTQREKLNLKTYKSTLLDIYRISLREKLRNIKIKYNNPKIYT